MTNATKFFAAAALAAGIAGAALAQTPHGHGAHVPAANAGGDAHRAEMQGMIDATMPSPGDAPSTQDFKAADMAMMRDMHVPYTGDADIDLRTHMIPHHRGAITMAEVALKHARDPETKAMARKIIDDQEREIAEMEAWLKKHAK